MGAALLEGRSCWAGGDLVGVACVVDAVVFLGEVVAPVLFEVAVGADRSELEDRFSARQAPAGAGDVHAVLDEVAARALDHAGGDRPALVEGGRIVQVDALVGQVGGAAIGARAPGCVQAGVGRGAPDLSGELGGVALEDVLGVAADLQLGGGVALAVAGRRQSSRGAAPC